jgi:hypothetical protein
MDVVLSLSFSAAATRWWESRPCAGDGAGPTRQSPVPAVVGGRIFNAASGTNTDGFAVLDSRNQAGACVSLTDAWARCVGPGSQPPQELGGRTGRQEVGARLQWSCRRQLPDASCEPARGSAWGPCADVGVLLS